MAVSLLPGCLFARPGANKAYRYLKNLLVLIAAAGFNPAVASARLLQYVVAAHNGYYKAIDLQGHILADSLRPASHMFIGNNVADEAMFPFFRDDKMGFKDHHNRVVVQPAYISFAAADIHWLGQELNVTRFRNGLAVVLSPGRKFGIIDKKGNLVADTVYDYISNKPEAGVYPARKGDTLYLLNSRGSNILRHPYRTDVKLYPYPTFNEGLMPVFVPADIGPFRRHDYKVGFVDTRGTLEIDTVYRLSTGMLGDSETDMQMAIMQGGFCGTGLAAMRRAPKPEDPFYLASDYYRFEAGRCLVNKGGQDLVINRSNDSIFSFGSRRLPYRGDRIQNRQGFFIIHNTANLLQTRTLGCLIVDRRGKPLLDSLYDGAELGDNGFFLLKRKTGGSFYIDTTGKRRFEGPFSIADAFSGGMARVLYAGKGSDNDNYYGHLDTSGRFIPLPRAWTWYSKDGLIIGSARKGKEAAGTGMMNWQLQWIIPPVYEELYPFNNGYAAFKTKMKQGGQWGLLDRRGKVVLPAVFDQISAVMQAEID